MAVRLVVFMLLHRFQDSASVRAPMCWASFFLVTYLEYHLHCRCGASLPYTQLLSPGKGIDASEINSNVIARVTYVLNNHVCDERKVISLLGTAVMVPFLTGVIRQDVVTVKRPLQLYFLSLMGVWRLPALCQAEYMSSCEWRREGMQQSRARFRFSWVQLPVKQNKTKQKTKIKNRNNNKKYTNKKPQTRTKPKQN